VVDTTLEGSQKEAHARWQFRGRAGLAPHGSAEDARTKIQLAAPRYVAITAQSIRQFGSQLRSMLVLDNLCFIGRWL
jgi:hypothetical protein